MPHFVKLTLTSDETIYINLDQATRMLPTASETIIGFTDGKSFAVKEKASAIAEMRSVLEMAKPERKPLS